MLLIICPTASGCISIFGITFVIKLVSIAPTRTLVEIDASALVARFAASLMMICLLAASFGSILWSVIHVASRLGYSGPKVPSTLLMAVRRPPADPNAVGSAATRAWRSYIVGIAVCAFIAPD